MRPRYEKDRESHWRRGTPDFSCSFHFLQPFLESLELFLQKGVYGSPGCRASLLEVDLAIIRSMYWKSVGGFFSHYSQILPEFHGDFF